MRKYLTLSLTAITVVLFAVAVIHGSPVHADSVTQDVQNGANAVGPTGGPTSLDSIVKTVIDILSVVAGVAAVIMIIIAGFKYVTSGGDSSSVSSAKNTLMYAIVGLIVVALAQTIVFFVLDNIK